MDTTQSLRFQFYQQLEDMFRRFCDQIALADLPPPDQTAIIQAILRARQASLSELVSGEELDYYSQVYREDLY